MLPATSSPDAELRGISRAVREALFTYGLSNEDFGLRTSSSTAITAARRIGPGSKLRRLEVCQGVLQAGKIPIRKVKGTSNPGNFLTKYAKGQALPSLGIVDVRDVAGSAPVTRLSVKAIGQNDPITWKGFVPKAVSTVITVICWRPDCATDCGSAVSKSACRCPKRTGQDHP